MIRHSLRRRLNRIFVRLSLGPLLLMGIMLTVLAFVIEERQAHIQQALVAQRVAQEIESFVMEIEAELNLAVQFGLLDISATDQEQLLLNLFYYHVHFEELVLLDDTGEEQIRLTRLEVVVPEQNISHAAAAEFVIPSTTGETYYGPVNFSATTGEPLMVLAVPVMDPRAGEVKAVLSAKVRLKQVWDLIAQMELRSGESVFIVDKSGRIVAHRNPSIVLRGVSFAANEEKNLQRGLDASFVILEKQEVQLGQSTLTVIAERNLLNALALPIITGVVTGSLTLLTWVIATLLGIRAVTHIVHPIQELAQTAHAIRGGDLSRQAVVTQQDEVGELAAAFNEMTEQLRQTLDGLHDKIEELEHLSRALQESENQYRSIFENAQEGIFRASVAGRFIMVNPALIAMLGYHTADEVLALDLVQDVYLAAADRGRLLDEVTQKGSLTNVEVDWKKADGTTITVRLYSHILYDTAHQVTGYEGLVLNVTEQKRMEIERETLIKELEAKNSELERFTYTVSHDLKSPLITIRGYLGYLQRDAAAGNMERFGQDITRITQASDKMHQLLNELLELSRIGRQTNLSEKIPFLSLIRDVQDLLEGVLTQKQVQLHIAPDLPVVYGDRLRLIELLQNLIDNAQKYSGDQPKPEIWIGLERIENHQGVFYVRDNGMGIEAAYFERVFGLFDKLNPTSEGTGVGLALVKRIIEIHGGRIWVESPGLGQGSIFFFTLPLA